MIAPVLLKSITAERKHNAVESYWRVQRTWTWIENGELKERTATELVQDVDAKELAAELHGSDKLHNEYIRCTFQGT